MEDDTVLEEKLVSEPENDEKEEHNGVIPPVIPRPIQDEPSDDKLSELDVDDNVDEQEEKIDPIQEEQEIPVIDIDNEPVVDVTEPEIQIPEDDSEERIDPSVIENAFKEENKDVPVIDVAPPKESKKDDIIRNVVPARKRVNIVDKTLERDAEMLNPEIKQK